ncbi:MAG: hypothetical protein KKC03_01250 [Bacteroidetes bacterium]|nr:hypothetical protein [Bacteroidota bacterium]
MGHEAIKLEIIEWLAKLDDIEKIEYLKIVKDSMTIENDWWDDLTTAQKTGIERGFEDICSGRTVSHDDVKRRYGL